MEGSGHMTLHLISRNNVNSLENDCIQKVSIHLVVRCVIFFTEAKEV